MTTPAGPVVLIGMMGTGKTTVGKIVASRLDRRLFDSDAMIEGWTGKKVAELWREGGEPAFRALETEALSQALVASPPPVVAAAGGVVLSPANRVLLQRASDAGAVVVWLCADAHVLAGRVRAGDHRPLLADDPEGTLRRLVAEREPLYDEVADRRVDVSRHTPVQAADLVLDEVAAVAAERADA